MALNDVRQKVIQLNH